MTQANNTKETVVVPVADASLLEKFTKLVTDDVLNALGEAPNFTKQLVGKEFYVAGLEELETRDQTNDDTYKVIDVVMDNARPVRWYLSNYMRYMQNEAKVPFAGLHLKGQKGVFQFKTVGFEPSIGYTGNFVYTHGIIDMAKVMKNDEVWKQWRSSDRKIQGLARQYFRDNIETLAYDRYLKDGEVTEEANDQFRLGTITVEVMQTLTK